MKKKLLLLIGLLILLTGCTTEVNIYISDNGVSEEIIIESYPTSYITKAQIKTAFRKYVPAYGSVLLADSEADQAKRGVSYYTYNIVDFNNGYKTTYSYTFPLKRYYDARTLKEAYLSSSVTNNDNEFTILTDTSGNQYLYLYPDLDKLVINVKTDYEIEDSNADSCNSNSCKWVYTKDSNNKGIYIKLKKTKTNSNNSNNNNNNNSNNNQNNNNQNNNQNNNNQNNNNQNNNNQNNNENSDNNLINYNEESYNEEDEENEGNSHIFVIIVVAILVFLIVVVVANKKDRE